MMGSFFLLHSGTISQKRSLPSRSFTAGMSRHKTSTSWGFWWVDAPHSPVPGAAQWQVEDLVSALVKLVETPHDFCGDWFWALKTSPPGGSSPFCKLVPP